MRRSGESEGVAFFFRDADNIDLAPVVVLIGTCKEAVQIPACGFVDCDAMVNAGWYLLIQCR